MNENINIKDLKAAKRYAQALVQSIGDNYDEILNDLSEIDNIIFQNNEFKTFFFHPIVSLKDKKDILNDTLKRRINDTSLNFIQILLDENRFSDFKTILYVFQKEVGKLKNKQKIDIISAVELDEETKTRLKNKLNEKLNKDIILNFSQNNDIIAGLILKTDDKVLDLSLKNKFETLKKQALNFI